MRVRHELEKLKTTADRIHNNYNVVEAVNEEMEKVCDQNLFYPKAYCTMSNEYIISQIADENIYKDYN